MGFEFFSRNHCDANTSQLWKSEIDQRGRKKKNNRCSGHKPPPTGPPGVLKPPSGKRSLVKMKVGSPQRGSQATQCFCFPRQDTVPEEATSSWEILKDVARSPATLNQLGNRSPRRKDSTHPYLCLGSYLERRELKEKLA